MRMIYMADLQGGRKGKGWDCSFFTSVALFWKRPGFSLCSSLLGTTRAIYLENFSSTDTGSPGLSGGWRDAHSLPLSLLSKEELRKTKARRSSRGSQRSHSPNGGHRLERSQLPSFPGSVPGEGEDDLHTCLTQCWRAVWPPNYGRNTEPLALEVSGATRGGAATQLPACT